MEKVTRGEILTSEWALRKMFETRKDYGRKGSASYHSDFKKMGFTVGI